MDAARLRTLQSVGIAVLVWLACCLAWCLTSTVVHAAGPSVRVHVAANSCPDATLIRQQLEPLLGSDAELTFDENELGRADAGHAAISDLGDRYVVEINGLRRELPDAARDCVERARVATVFIALNLKEPAPPPAPPPPKVEREPIAAPPPKPWLQVGLIVFGEAAYAPQIERVAPGGGAGVWLGHGALRFDAGLGFLAATDLVLERRDALRASVALMRFPLSLSVNYALKVRRWRFGPTIGAELELLHLRGRDVERAQSELRFNPGALLALDTQLELAPAWAAWLRLGASGFPRAYDLAVDPEGKLGQTPRWWLQAKLGLGYQFQ